MAILEIRQSEAGQAYEKERELEIKKLVTEIEVGHEAVIRIECKITAYRTSFEYFKNQFNNEMKEKRRFSFSKTENYKEWIVRRTA
jgi:hypothetical protein